MALEEVLWTAAALIGMLLWARNFHESYKTLAAAKKLLLRNGRMMWARYERRKTAVFVGIEALLVVVGVNQMLREQNPHATLGSRIVVTICLFAMSAAIVFIAFDWGRVHQAMLADDGKRETRDQTRDAQRDQTRDAERDEARDSERDLGRDMRRDSPRDLARDEARDH